MYWLACKADAKISVSSGSRYVGGIVGYRIMILAACYSTGEITGVTPTLRNYIGAIPEMYQVANAFIVTPL